MKFDLSHLYLDTYFRRSFFLQFTFPVLESLSKNITIKLRNSQEEFFFLHDKKRGDL